MASKKRTRGQPKARDEAVREKAVAPPSTSKQISRRTLAIALSILLLLFTVLTLTSSLQKSPTMDEPVHLLAGYSYLKWGDFRVNPEHPPLAKILAALPLLAFDIKDPRPSSPDWDRIPENEPGDPAVNVAQKMLFGQNDADTLFFYAKLPMIVLGIVLGIFVYLWSKKLFGTRAALTSLFLYCLDPNILAHGAMIHTDVSFTAFFFIGTYFFWMSLRKITWSSLSLTALFFGLAAITKHSFPVILLIWGILGLFWIFSSEPQVEDIEALHTIPSRRQRAWILTGILLGALVTAYVFLWAGYGFRFRAIPGAHRPLDIAQVMPDRSFVQKWASLISEYRLLPEAWTYGQLFVLKRLKRPTYLLGEISNEGFLLYFPVAFAAKTPVPTLLLLLGTVGLWLWGPSGRKRGIFLMVPVIVYFLLAGWSRLNIGLRHILPIYPFLFVMIGGTAAWLWSGRMWVNKAVLIFLALWYLWSVPAIHPHYLAYFNELAGGAENGHKILVDSNLDWGQDLKGLKGWMDENRVKKIHFLYFGKADPQYYGIDALYLPGSWVIRNSLNNEVPNYLAVSVSHYYAPEVYLSKQQETILKSFRLGDPIATIGYSILVHKIDLNNADIYYNMGYTLASRGQLSQAIDLFKQSLRIDPEFAEAHESLARALALQGKKKEAAKHYEEAVRILKSRSEIRTPQ